MKEVEFGYYPEPIDWQVGDVAVATLPSLKETVRKVARCKGVEGDWIYSPPQRRAIWNQVRPAPYPSRVFTLPKTHVLKHRCAETNNHASFLVWCLGFFVGMRLSDTEAGFLDATPIKPGKLHDITWSSGSIRTALGCSDSFWRVTSGNPSVAKALTGVIHSLFLADAPRALDYERLIYLYIALDGCHFVSASMHGRDARDGTHEKRVGNLCNEFSMPVPTWARSNGRTNIATYRNETLHEGLFFGEPLGFKLFGGAHSKASPADNVLLEMKKLVCRLLCALLGLPAAAYIQSPVDDRQRRNITLPAIDDD